MTKKLLVDVDRCVGCYSCEVACKQEHRIPVGIKRVNLNVIGPRIVAGSLRSDFVPVFCMHCDKPPCVEACPNGSLYKRSDGVVLLNAEQCIGCLYCIEACPFGAIQHNAEKHVVEKCDLCVHLTDKGSEPPCVKHCMGQCLYYGEANNFPKKIQERYAGSLVNINT